MLVVRLRQPKHLTPPKSHQRRCLGDPDPAIRQILQHAHPDDLRPAHRNHSHRPNAPQLKPWRVTFLSGPTVTSLSGVYTNVAPIECYGTSARLRKLATKLSSLAQRLWRPDIFRLSRATAAAPLNYE